MTTGAVGTALLWVVAMRSIMGKASWIRLKPFYSYVSPIGIWFSTVHVISFGAKGWNTLFNMNFHNGQLSITFVSSMFPTCVLLVHHIMALFHTKKICSGNHLWKHSVVNVASNHYNKVVAKVKTVGVNVGKMDRKNTATESFHSFDIDSVKDFEDFLYKPESSMRSESQAAVPVGFK